MTQRRRERRETEQGDSEEEALMGVGTIRPGTRPGEVEVPDGKRWLMGGGWWEEVADGRWLMGRGG